MTRPGWLVIVVLAFAAWFAASPAWAAPVVRVTGAEAEVSLIPRTELLDPAGALSPREALARLSVPDAVVDTKVYSRGYIPDVLWARIVLDVDPAAAGRWYLSLELPNFDRLDVYTVPDGGEPVPFVALGDRVPAVTDIRTRFHIAAMDLKPGRTVLLVRGRTGSTMTLALKLRKLDQLLVEEQAFFALQTFFLGISTILFLSAAGLFAYTRQPIYLIYLIGVVAHSGIWLLINGTGPGHLWPELAGRFHVDPHPLVAVSIFTTAAFAGSFLSTARVPVLVRQIFWAMAVIGLVLALVAAVVPPDYVYWTSGVVSNVVLPVSALLLVLTSVGLYRGEPAARPLMLTWVGLVGAVILAVLRDVGIVPNSVFTLSGAQLGSVFEMVIFAYMLIRRLGQIQSEKEELQRQALAAAREHEAVLERRVADRTAELDAANVRLRSIVSSAPFPLVLAREADDRILFVNQRACDLIGLPRDALVGRSCRIWFADPSDFDRIVGELAFATPIEDREVELLRADGTTIWTLTSVVRIVYDGEPVRLSALNDITRLKALEHDLRETADLEAAAAERERSARQLQQQFVAMVSHEFRTPLAIIDGAAQNVRARDERGAGRLLKIRAAVQRLLRMIDTCLVDERVDGGVIVLQREFVDLVDLLAEAVDTIRAAAPGHTVDLVLADGPASVWVDPRLAEIAMNNLLENAVKYAPSGTTVTVRVAPERDAVSVVVEDEGPGIPEADRDRIFEKYYRAQNTAGTAGAGLGLHLVRAIMNAHGGSVACLPGSPKGSRFVLRFMRSDATGTIPAGAVAVAE